jgi:hypothetical protein
VLLLFTIGRIAILAVGSLFVPTLVLRKETERSEAITAGIAKLVDELTIKPSITHIIENINKRNKNKVFPYGDGNAAERICNIFQLLSLHFVQFLFLELVLVRCTKLPLPVFHPNQLI